MRTKAWLKLAHASDNGCPALIERMSNLCTDLCINWTYKHYTQKSDFLHLNFFILEQMTI